MIDAIMLSFRSLIGKSLENYMAGIGSDEVKASDKALLSAIESQLTTSEKKSSKKCPQCHEAFHIVSLNEVELDGCKACGSLWFDRGELQMVRHDPKERIKDFLHAGRSTYKCPVCRMTLSKRSFLFPEKIVVDICPKEHGVYFEKNELEVFLKLVG